MLRLLAQREQGYEDIAALMGLSVEQVRAKVAEALEEIGSDDALATAATSPPTPAAVQPAEVAPAPAVEPPKPAEVEKPVAAPKSSPPAPATPAPRPHKPSPPPKVSLPSSRRRLVEWVGGAAIVVLIVLFATGTVDLGGSSSDSTTTSTGAGSSEGGEAGNAAANSSQATKAVLTPVKGGEGAGLALFGRIKKTAVLQVEAKGLKPSPKGQSYTVWLYRSPKVVLRVGAVAVGKNGIVAAQFPIPAQVLAYVAGGAFDQIDVSLTPNAAYEAEVAQAEKQKRLPAYTGTDVLRGEITGPAIQKK
jgi:hypothetical protein